MDYEIVNGGAVPPPQFGRRRQDPYGISAMPLAQLQVGHYFTVPMNPGEPSSKMQPFIRRAADKLGIVIAMRRSVEGLQVWRSE